MNSVWKLSGVLIHEGIGAVVGPDAALESAAIPGGGSAETTQFSKHTKVTEENKNSRVAWKHIAHPHTDLQVQICYLQQAIYWK